MAKRRLRIGRNKMYAVKDKQGNVMRNCDDIIKAANYILKCIIEHGKSVLRNLTRWRKYHEKEKLSSTQT